MKSILISILFTTIGFSQSGNINYKHSQQYQIDMKKNKYIKLVKTKREYLIKLNEIESCLLLAERRFELNDCEAKLSELYHKIKDRRYEQRGIDRSKML